MRHDEKDGKAAAGHLTPRQLEDFRRRMLEPQQLLWASRHLSACRRCQKELRNAQATPSLPSLLPEDGEVLHLDYAQMTAYMDSQLDEIQRERLESHIMLCASCARELHDLQEFDARINEQLQPVSAAESQVATQPFWSRFVPAFHFPGWSWSHASGLALIVVGAMGLFSIRPGGSDRNLNAVQSGAEAVSHPHGSVLYVSIALIVLGIGYFLSGRFRKK